MSETEKNEQTKNLAAELLDDVEIVKQGIAAYKRGGVPALLAVLPGAAEELRQDIEATLRAVPEIRAGYKTTEFWLTAGLMLGNGIYTAATGKVLPFDLNATLTALVGVYALARAVIKAVGQKQ